MDTAHQRELVAFILATVVDSLNRQKKTDDGYKIVAFFTPDTAHHSKGMDEFNELLGIARDGEATHSVDKNGKLRHYRLEEALFIVLQDAGTTVPLVDLVDADKAYQQKQVAATQPKPPAEQHIEAH